MIALFRHLLKTMSLTSTVLVVMWLPCAPSLAQNKAQEAVGAKQKREEVRKKLNTVQRAIEQTSQEKKLASKALHQLEQRLRQTTQHIQSLDSERKQLAFDIDALEARETQVALDLRNTQARIAAVLRNQYRRIEINPTQAWLAGQSASQASRESYWFERISEAEKTLGDTQQTQAATLKALREGLETKKDQLIGTIAQQNQAKRELAAQQDERHQLLEDLSSKLKNQELEQKRLQRDETRLTSVINQITKAIEEARRKKALEEQRKNKQPNATPPRGRQRDSTPPPMQGTGEFAKGKGHLVLPVQGTIVGQFGKTRSNDGQGPVWRGLFIATQEGQPVRAVGKGRVVFSEWLRGFGSLIILDHGDEYLSVYGNNKKLLKKTGDSVNLGDIVAETGNSSGNLDTGLYFELRRQGQAVDPLSWTKGH